MQWAAQTMCRLRRVDGDNGVGDDVDEDDGVGDDDKDLLINPTLYC